MGFLPIFFSIFPLQARIQVFVYEGKIEKEKGRGKEERNGRKEYIQVTKGKGKGWKGGKRNDEYRFLHLKHLLIALPLKFIFN